MKFSHLLFLVLFCLYFGLFSSTCKANNRFIDSLTTLLKTDKPDTNKVNHLNKLSESYLKLRQFDSALNYASQAIDLINSFSNSSLKGWPKGMAMAYANMGIIYQYQSNYPVSLKNFEAALENNQLIKDNKGIAFCYSKIGSVYSMQGNYPEALKNHLKALKIREEIGDKKEIAISYNNIGVVYYFQKNYTEAMKNYNLALDIDRETGNREGMIKSYGNIGSIYASQGNFDDALENCFLALNLSLESKNKHGIARAYNNIGAIYERKAHFSEAIKNYSASLKIKEAIGDKEGVIISLANMGVVYTKLRNYKLSQEYLDRALALSKEIGLKEMIKGSYLSLVTLDSLQGNWKQAYEHHKLFISYRDSIDNEETRKKIIENALNYEFEKKEIARNAEQEKKDAVTASDKKRQQHILVLVLCALLLVFVLAGIIFRSLRLTRKQKQVIEEKNKVVEEKNKDIIDSINYAKKIQDALLHEAEHFSKYLPEYFILFKPKDIVSGDFYWSFKKEFKGVSYRYIAAADCTGHGVPGAFMSMLGIAFLNEIAATNRLHTPAEILEKLRNRILREMGQSGQSKDGMDISLVCFNPETRVLQWAGANNPLYIVRRTTLEKENGLEEIKPNKQPIGYHLEMQPFTNHLIKLEKGSVFYLFTDGYADQFGGKKEKKFMYSKFKELLLSISDKPMEEQKEILNLTFEDWKAGVQQVDDVCVIGVRV